MTIKLYNRINEQTRVKKSNFYYCKSVVTTNALITFQKLL